MNDNLLLTENSLYIRKENGKLFPVSHPDISTQPSILPERFGKLRIIEVAIPISSKSEIFDKGIVNINNEYGAIQEGEFIFPNATIISCTLFSLDMMINPTKVIKENSTWKIYFDMQYFNSLKYCLVKYFYMHN